MSNISQNKDQKVHALDLLKAIDGKLFININNTKGTFSSKELLLKALEAPPNKKNDWGKTTVISGRITIYRHKCHTYIFETDEKNQRIAQLRIPPGEESTNKLIEQLGRYKYSDKILTWNLGLAWNTSDNYEGAWRFEQVAETIADKNPEIICLQEVPETESSLGKQNYFGRLCSMLQDWNYDVYYANRGKQYLITAFRKDFACFKKQALEDIEFKRNGANFHNSFLIEMKIIKENKFINVVNVHLPHLTVKEYAESNYAKCLTHYYQYGQNVWIAGDFNFNYSSVISGQTSGAKYNGGEIESSDNLDYIVHGNDVIQSYVLEIDPDFPLKTNAKEGAYFHRPVIGNLELTN